MCFSVLFWRTKEIPFFLLFFFFLSRAIMKPNHRRNLDLQCCDSQPWFLRRTASLTPPFLDPFVARRGTAIPSWGALPSFAFDVSLRALACDSCPPDSGIPPRTCCLRSGHLHPCCARSCSLALSSLGVPLTPIPLRLAPPRCSSLENLLPP